MAVQLGREFLPHLKLDFAEYHSAPAIIGCSPQYFGRFAVREVKSLKFEEGSQWNFRSEITLGQPNFFIFHLNLAVLTR